VSEPQGPPRPRPVSLVRGPRGRRTAIIKGQDYGRFTDIYHGVLTASWPLFFLELLAAFIIVNLLFAMLYVGDPGGIANARPGNFADAFFFSVQTLGTLGYGVMAPRTLYTNLLVTMESFSRQPARQFHPGRRSPCLTGQPAHHARGRQYAPLPGAGAGEAAQSAVRPVLDGHACIG
jgi:Ion channel